MTTSTKSTKPPRAANPALLKKLEDLYVRVGAVSEFYKANRLLYYKPHPKQQAFHYADTNTGRVVFGGNRSGKTTAGATESIAHAWGYRPWLPEGHPHRIVRLADGQPIPVPNVGRIICEDFETTMMQIIWPKLEEWIPADVLARCTFRRNPRGVPMRLTFPKELGGSSIYFMSYDQNVRKFEGQAHHWFWPDEPCPQAIFSGLRRGLIDYNGHYWMTMTPLAEPWINTTLMSRANVPGSGIFGYSWDMEDNCKQHSGGTLDHAAIESALEDFEPEEREARRTGQPLHLVGRVFKDWRAYPPLWVEPFDIPKDWPRVCVIDPHDKKPVAVLWAAISPDGIWIIYRDLFDPELYTVRDVAREMRRQEGWHEQEDPSVLASQAAPRTSFRFVPGQSEEVCFYIIDTSANTTQRTSGKTIKQEFAEHGIHCADAVKQNKSAGINAIKQAIRARNKWDEPGLITFNTCWHVKQNFENYVWPRPTGIRTSNQVAEKQEPVKKNDDFLDCIRYLYQMRLSYGSLQTAVSTMRSFASRQSPNRGPRLGTRFKIHPQFGGRDVETGSHRTRMGRGVF